MRCVSYTRFTSCAVERSTPADIIGQQNTRIQAFCAENGWKIEEKYSDRKNDPETDDAFQRLREDGIARKFEMVVVDSIFRCGRNVSFAEDVLLKVFFPAGIHFAVVEDGMVSLGKSVEEISSYITKKRNLYISGSTKRYALQQYENGYYTIGDERYGYILSKDQRTLTVDEEAAEIIREIFLRVTMGESSRQVANDLNERGIEAPRKRIAKMSCRKNWQVEQLWTGSSVNRIHSCTAYLGSYTKTVLGETITVKCPAILDETTYKLYQESPLRKRGLSHPWKSKRNLLARLVYDGNSGKVLYYRNHAEGTGPTKRFHRNADPNSAWIAFETVIEAVKTAIYQEEVLAKRVLAQMQAAECERKQAAAREKLVLQGQRLCVQINEAAAADIQAFRDLTSGLLSDEDYRADKEKTAEEMKRYEEQFECIMKMAEELPRLYSVNNPWLERYLNEEIPDEMQRDYVVQRVEKVLVYNMNTIEVKLKTSPWKEQLPQEWLEEENGKEKQTDAKHYCRKHSGSALTA